MRVLTLSVWHHPSRSWCKHPKHLPCSPLPIPRAVSLRERQHRWQHRSEPWYKHPKHLPSLPPQPVRAPSRQANHRHLLSMPRPSGHVWFRRQWLTHSPAPCRVALQALGLSYLDRNTDSYTCSLLFEIVFPNPQRFTVGGCDNFRLHTDNSVQTVCIASECAGVCHISLTQYRAFW